MPRDGSGIYTQPFPLVVDGTTIESAVYNGFTTDVAQDLNTPRPIVAGGTGASSADGALAALGAEKARQSVTNYSTHPWVSGSFLSYAGATDAPNGHAFAGWCYTHANDSYVVVHAHDLFDTEVPTRTYTREKRAGSWGPWLTEGRTTMGTTTGIGVATGDMFFGITGTSPASYFVVTNDATAAGGTNLFTISRTGVIAAVGSITANDPISSASGMDTPVYNVTGSANFSIYASSGSRFLQFANGYSLRLGSDNHTYFAAAGTDAMRVQSDGNLLMLNGKLPYRPGGGPWLDNSDARIKTVTGDYEHGLDEILALQPVRYTFKGNNTGPGEALKDGAVVPYENSPHYTQAKDAVEFIGLIAQEVEQVLPEMVAEHTATIDGQPVTDLRTLDTGPLVFVLINAVKTLAARIEALEAG